jgi:hypothetical protein
MSRAAWKTISSSWLMLMVRGTMFAPFFEWLMNRALLP